MKYVDFIETIISRGINAAKQDYIRIESMQVVVDKYKLDGAIAGFEVCRNKTPTQLVTLWIGATEKMNNVAKSRSIDKKTYWYWRCYQAEVEWICDVVSAMLVNNGKRTLIKGLPTIKAVDFARKILFVERN